MARRKGVTGRGRRRGASGATVLWSVALAVLIGVAATGAAFTYNVLSSRVSYDQATLCPEDGPRGVMAILLDLTDPLSTGQAQRLEALLEQSVAAVPEHKMISVGVVSADPRNWGAGFARCKPASGQNANALYENATLMGERFEKDFAEPLRTTITRMMASATENQSPIMESLQALLAETPEILAAEEPLSVIIVSDLLQHSDTLSFYRGEGWEAFVASGAESRLAKSLGEARIKLIRIPRPEAGAVAVAHVDPFWSRYLDRQGAEAPLDIVSLGDL